MSPTPIPYSFIRRHLTLSWRDVLWGYERQLLGWADVVEIARDQLLTGAVNTPVTELSWLGKSETEQIGDLLRDLACDEPEREGRASIKKWLFLALAWLYEKRADFQDPLNEVDCIYADFDYPPEIEGFVSYMPVAAGYDPREHTAAENKARLYLKWEQYLLEAKDRLQ